MSKILILSILTVLFLIFFGGKVILGLACFVIGVIVGLTNSKAKEYYSKVKLYPQTKD